MKKGQTIEQYMTELEMQKRRVEAFAKVIEHIDEDLKYMCEWVVEKEGYSEEYTDENGETKRRYHSPEYKTDENGEYIRIEPKKDSYYYEKYTAMKAVKDEILAII